MQELKLVENNSTYLHRAPSIRHLLLGINYLHENVKITEGIRVCVDWLPSDKRERKTQSSSMPDVAFHKDVRNMAERALQNKCWFRSAGTQLHL